MGQIIPRYKESNFRLQDFSQFMVISALGLSRSRTYLVPGEDGGGWVGRSPSVPRQRGRLYTQGRIRTSSRGVGKSLLTPGTVTQLRVDFMLIWVNEGRLNTRTKPGYVLYRALNKGDGLCKRSQQKQTVGWCFIAGNHYRQRAAGGALSDRYIYCPIYPREQCKKNARL